MNTTPHNPANVPDDKLPPGRRFLTRAENNHKSICPSPDDPAIWAWGYYEWDDNEGRGYKGSSNGITYCVPNDFTV